MSYRFTRPLLALPLLLAVYSNQASANPVSLTNAGFETAWTGGAILGAGYVYRPTSNLDLGWSFVGGSGVSNSNTAWNGVANEGGRFAFLQSVGASISQSFNLTTLSEVTAQFAMSLRPGYAAGQGVAVKVDGNIVASYQANSTSWQTQSVNLGTLSAGSHALSFASTYQGGTLDTSAFVDAVNLNAVAAVPVPGMAWLFASSVLALAIKRRKH